MKLKSRISDILNWTAQIPLGKLLACLPVKFILPIARLVGLILSLPRNAGKNYARKMHIMIPGSPSNVGKKLISHRPLVFCERMKFQGFITEKRLENLYEVEGLERLDRVLKKGAGAIIQLSHFGAFEPGYLYLARKGYKIHVIRVVTNRSSNVESPFLNKHVTKIRLKMLNRTNMGWIFFKPENSYTALMSDLLSKNEIIITLLDAGARYYIDAPFFGGKLRIASNSAFLAWKFNVPLIALFGVRKKNKYNLTIEEPYYPVNDMNTTVHDATCRFASLFEKYLRAYPDQWYILQNLEQRINKDGTWTLSMPRVKVEQYYDLKDFGLE